MTSPVRPIFQEQERLTARRLNAAVEYLRSALRRVLLAPLSPGVATGLELTQAQDGSRITVTPGIAIDGRGRLLVLTDALAFGIVDVQKQIPDLGIGESFSIHLALDDRYASFDPCAAQQPLEVVERVKLVFRKAPPAEMSIQILPIAGLLGLLHSLAPSLSQPWDELDPAGRPSDDFRVRLGQAKWNGESGPEDEKGFRETSMASRTGVVPRFAGLRNSFGQMSMVLGRDAGGKATIGVSVPTTFGVGAAVTHQAPVDFQTDLLVKGAAKFYEKVVFLAAAGGTRAQAAVVAEDVEAPPAGRVSPSDPRVFEAAGGRVGAPPGVSGVLAVSMELDVDVAGPLGFSPIQYAGVPLALSASPSLSTAPKVAPFRPDLGIAALIGLSAGASNADGTSVTTVPVATAGVIYAYVRTAAAAGQELTPDYNHISGAKYPLVPATASGALVVALNGLAAPGSMSTQVPVWAIQPYRKL